MLSQDTEGFCIHSLRHTRFDGSNVELAVLGYETLPDNHIVVTSANSENMDVFMQYDQKIQFFGNRLAGDQAYIPKPTELCLAKSKSHWYRSVYINSSNSDEALVYCFDYGIYCTVMPTDIRVRIHFDTF